MSPDTDITIRPQRGAWMFVLLPFLAVALASVMLHLGINPFWWVPLLALIAIAILVGPYKVPVEIIFRAKPRTMEIRYRFGRRPKVYAFDEFNFIRSHIEISGEADTYIQLEVCLKNGNRIPLMSELAAWDSSAPLVGLSGAREPQSLTDLRRNIATTTGVQDFGLCH